MRKLRFEWKGMVYGCLKKHKRDLSSGGLSWHERECKILRHWQTLASLCLLIIPSSMRLFSLVSERPPSCTQKSCNRQRDVSRTCPVSPRLNANEEATQCGYCGCHNRAAPSSLTSNGHAHLPHSPTTSCIIPYLSDENERRLIHDQMLLLLFFFNIYIPASRTQFLEHRKTR